MDAKEAYEQRMEAQLKLWNADIAKLKRWSACIAQLQARAGAAKGQSKSEYLERIDQLRRKQSRARKKADELKKAGNSGWWELKAGLELAWDDLGISLESAVSRFKASS